MTHESRHLEDPLLEAAREIGSALTPKDLTERHVKRVRFVSRDQLGELLRRAVQKALDARRVHERGLVDLADGVQEGLLGLLRGANEFETARRSIAEQRAAVSADIAEISRLRPPAAHDPRDVVIDRLERRVKKLVDALEESERALSRAMRSSAIEDGVPSLYKVVQGLSESEAEFERKREMMADIFSANVELQEQFAAARRVEGPRS